MRLIVVGNLDGQLATAAQIARDNGAPALHADGIGAAVDIAVETARAGQGADVVIADVAVDIRGLAARLRAADLAAPIVACGTRTDARTAVTAVHAGAREYIPLPPDPEVIAAILAAVADDGQAPLPLPSAARHMNGNTARGKVGEATNAVHAMLSAESITDSLVGRTVADVERDLILETLKRCLGNRTHAAGILGISVRTLRNKLAVYAAQGIDVPPPNSGEIRGAA